VDSSGGLKRTPDRPVEGLRSALDCHDAGLMTSPNVPAHAEVLLAPWSHFLPNDLTLGNEPPGTDYLIGFFHLGGHPPQEQPRVRFRGRDGEVLYVLECQNLVIPLRATAVTWELVPERPRAICRDDSVAHADNSRDPP
jgi:hypothetical protein